MLHFLKKYSTAEEKNLHGKLFAMNEKKILSKEQSIKFVVLCVVVNKDMRDSGTVMEF